MFAFISEIFIEIIAAVCITSVVIFYKLIQNKRKSFMESTRIRNNLYWSPDNTKACFIVKEGKRNDIYLFDVQTFEKKKIASQIVEFEIPMWSPDSSKIAFVSDCDGNCEIYVVDAVNGDLQRITYDPLDNISPRWSPDGKKLMYFTKKENEIDISVIEMNEPTLVEPITETLPEKWNLRKRVKNDGLMNKNGAVILQ